MWAPEDGRGALGGPWAARALVAEGNAARVLQEKSGFELLSGGDDEDLGGLEVELFYEDDLELIASY
ncbi:hypothetical protein [Pyxidicoccus trucidator]|uniref:hypothetical protein n=1 Tax=Pyxidicoccus trucidator TaxID=2709662 RepID=UPI0013DC217E|nr:hypothetical protein [Pyxidicoccus trucidator]